MECERVNKHKSWLYLLLILVLMVCRTQGGCVEEERKALLEIKASLIDTHASNVNHLLPTWVDHGSTGENGGECCNWERVKCNTTTWHVTHLSLSNMMEVAYKDCERSWPLNVSLFFHFKELTSLNLSYDCLNDWNIVNTGVERLSSLKKLEILDLSSNYIGTFTVSSLGALTSLRNLHLGENELDGVFPALALENLEILDLTNAFNKFYKLQGFERVSLFKKLEILNLAGNEFNESIITSLSALPLLKVLDLTYNKVYGSFPAAELAGLTSLEELNLSWNRLDQAPRIQDCKRLSSLKKLKSIALGGSHVNKNVVSCLSALPFLTTLDLSRTYMFGVFFPLEDLYDREEYETLDLHNSGLESLTLNG